jgi:hypothetical protein
MNNPSQMKRGHTPSPDKGRVGEGLAALENHQGLMRIEPPLKTPLNPPLSGGKTRPQAEGCTHRPSQLDQSS